MSILKLWWRIGIFWKQVLGVLSGSAIAQLIPILGYLVIARLFHPAEFGAYAAWVGIVLILAAIITFRYEMALSLVKDGYQRQVAVWSVVLIAVPGVFLSALIVFIASFFWSGWVDNLTWNSTATLIPAAFLMALTMIWQFFAAAEGRYKSLSLMRVVSAAGITLLQIIFGMCFPEFESSLMVAHVAGLLVGVVVSIYIMPLISISRVRYRDIFWFIKRYRRFPILSLFADTINVGASQLPILIVSYRFGADIAGYLALTIRVMGAPIGIMGKAVLDVFRRHATVSWREIGNCKKIYIQTFIVLSFASMFAMLFFWYASAYIFVVFFGERWAYSGVIAIWLLPLFLLRFVASPLSYMFYLAEKQHIDLIWQLFLLLMTIATLSLFETHQHALVLYSAGYSTLYLAYLGMSYSYSRGTI